MNAGAQSPVGSCEHKEPLWRYADEIVVEAKRTDRRGEVFGQRQSGDLNAFNRGRVPFWSDARRDGEQVLLSQEPTPGFTRIPKYERFYVVASRSLDREHRSES